MRFRFLSSLLRLVLVLVCLFVASFSTLTHVPLLNSFPEIILNKCEQISFLLGFCVFDAVNDAITLHWHLLHSSLSGETSSWNSTLKKKKICVREMAVEVGSSLVVLGATWGTLEFFPYNRDVAIISFLLSMLLASPVVG